MTRSSAVFFDVDGTLTTDTTLFRFLDFWMAARGLPPGSARQERDRLRRMTEAGAPRDVTNRSYFRCFTGCPEKQVTESGDSWFRAELRQGGLLNPSVVAAFREHARRGTRTALVSGSFPALLDPLARHLGADIVLCTRPETVDGRHTGAVDVPMIGEAKRTAVLRTLANLGVARRRAWAYGDHVSDMPMLESVGAPVVVGDDPDMVGIARTRGWRRLPRAEKAPPTPVPEAAAADPAVQRTSPRPTTHRAEFP